MSTRAQLLQSHLGPEKPERGDGAYVRALVDLVALLESNGVELSETSNAAADVVAYLRDTLGENYVTNAVASHLQSAVERMARRG
jgi:hypothetical protein